MALNLVNLDSRTRKLMLEELEVDVQAGNLYLSPRLSSIGRRDYEGLLREAIQSGNDAMLAGALRSAGRMNQIETTVKGHKNVPVTAPETLAEGEFNRFYARGLCRRAIEDSTGVVVYRAKQVQTPRADSEAKIGAQMDAQALLNDLRNSIGVEPALGLPPGPNSGLSVQLR
jgi:hypothetical protein